MLVVTLPPSAARNPAAFAKKAKQSGASLLEIRGDLTPHLTPFQSPLPILLSPRGYPLDGFKAFAVDLELHECERSPERPKKAKLIVSIHDYDKTPALPRLKKTVLQMMKYRPWAVKIATFIRTYDDLLTLSALQDWLRQRGQRSVVIGMGEKAHLSRVTSPLCNALTYASLDGHEASASGQLPLSFYALTQGRTKPLLFGIIGGPHITASKSPLIHNALFQRHKVDALYSSFPTDDFAAAMRVLTKGGVSGLSVTAPFKRDACTIATDHEDAVKELGVANTLRRSGTAWYAFNSDWYGILHGYPELARAKKVAILGSGGAVPSAIRAVRKANPKAVITVYARDPEKARKTLAACRVQVEYISDSRKASADAVICAVSEDKTLSFPRPASSAATAIDLRYGKPTRFLVAAAKARYRTRDGVPMLIHQALRQFQVFTGQDPAPSDAAFLTRLLSSPSHGQ